MESNHLQKRNLPSIQDRNTLMLIKIIVYISTLFTNSGLNISEKEKIVLRQYIVEDIQQNRRDFKVMTAFLGVQNNAAVFIILR